MTDDRLTPALADWIFRITGGGVVTDMRRVSDGARDRGVRLELAGSELPRIFLKKDAGVRTGIGCDLAREYDLLRKLERVSVRVPRAIGYDETLGALVLEFIAGDTSLAVIDGDDEWLSRVETSLASTLADLHAVDARAMELVPRSQCQTVSEAIAADLAIWRSFLFSPLAGHDDVTLFAFAWLSANIPESSRKAVLVQGDAGPGNFLFDDKGITALVDWEMAHLGDPLEDIGAVLARSLMQPAIDTERFMASYEAATGSSFSRRDVIYATVLVMAKFSALIVAALDKGDVDRYSSGAINYLCLSQISIVRLIASVEAIDIRLPSSASASSLSADPAIWFRCAVARCPAEFLPEYSGGIRNVDMVGAEAEPKTGSARIYPGFPGNIIVYTYYSQIMPNKGPVIARHLRRLISITLSCQDAMKFSLGSLYGNAISICLLNST